MFWGLILKSNKKYTQTLEKPFHLAHAALDHSSSDNDPVQVMYTHDENSYLLCTLQKGKVFQCPLDLNFQEGDKLCFSTKGNGIVHLTGFLLPEDDFDEFDDAMDDEEDEEESETEIDDLRQKLSKKEKVAQKPTKEATKKQQVQPKVEESDSDQQEDSDEQQESDDEGMGENAEVEDDSDEDGEESGEEESEDDSSDAEEPEAAPPKAKQQKLDAQAQQQNGKKQKQQNGLENGDSKKQQKEQKQKEKTGGDGKMQKLQGGLMVQDLKAGSGAEAKPGKKIQVYYEGRLKSNNKIFDATKSGQGFKMTLGRGEVIKGWDIGLSGMKVGGKRRLVCPPGLAYGAKGNPPVIPPNSTLVFDVELRNVS